MKKPFITILACALIGAATLGTACSNESDKKAAPAKSAVKTASALPNYRYVDLDTILSQYNLAKDYNEEIIRMQTQMESEVKKHENSIQSLAGQMQNKMQNNGYLTKESYDADQQKLNAMQANAQRSVGSLQQNFETKAMKAQQTVNDSIKAFIEDYNKKHGYDAIFFKAATLYINPELDITAEVVEGLNARYNKVKK